jgi:hypothetical protein
MSTRNWTTTESRIVVAWARESDNVRPALEAIAQTLDRTPEAVKEFLRRVLPREEWPWKRKPRWGRLEADQIAQGRNPNCRSKAALRKYKQRTQTSDAIHDHQPLTVTQVAQDLGRSRTTVHRLLRNGYLRRFKGGVAESSFESFLKNYPHLVPYGKLPVAQREWLVLNGFPDSDLVIKEPSVRGLLE